MRKMTTSEIFDWCKAHQSMPITCRICEATDDPQGGGGFYFHSITYANGDTYEHSERGRWSDTLFETRINGELVESRRGRS